MAEVKTQVNALLDQGREVCTADEARLEHEARTRRMQPPKGQRTRPVRGPAEDVPVLLRRPPPTSRTVTPYPIEQNQNTEQTILALERLQRETEAGEIAVVLDNARSHHARALTGLHEPGRLLERITPVYLPPYAPDHNPVEHVRNAAKNNIATIQHETPEETFGAFASYVTGRTFDYDFEHPHPAKPETILFHDGHTSPEASSKPAASDPNYAVNCEEPLFSAGPLGAQDDVPGVEGPRSPADTPLARLIGQDRPAVVQDAEDMLRYDDAAEVAVMPVG
ncbi:hypothetical protein PRAC110570_07450 [Propionibacterium acidifaciens]